ncbi:MAG: GTPase domain-containing protein, partial [Pseudanabaenaceae cyanobacterium]
MAKGSLAQRAAVLTAAADLTAAERQLLAWIQEKTAGGPPRLTVVGPPHSGKTALIRELLGDATPVVPTTDATLWGSVCGWQVWDTPGVGALPATALATAETSDLVVLTLERPDRLGLGAWLRAREIPVLAVQTKADLWADAGEQRQRIRASLPTEVPLVSVAARPLPRRVQRVDRFGRRQWTQSETPPPALGPLPAGLQALADRGGVWQEASAARLWGHLEQAIARRRLAAKGPWRAAAGLLFPLRATVPWPGSLVLDGLWLGWRSQGLRLPKVWLWGLGLAANALIEAGLRPPSPLAQVLWTGATLTLRAYLLDWVLQQSAGSEGFAGNRRLDLQGVVAHTFSSGFPQGEVHGQEGVGSQATGEAAGGPSRG